MKIKIIKMFAIYVFNNKGLCWHLHGYDSNYIA